MVLKEKEGERCLPIWIGETEASVISSAVKDISNNRPLIHDLTASIFASTDLKLAKVVIFDLRDNTFFASLIVHREGVDLEVDARPSDAIALALKLDAPIYVSDAVMAVAQVTMLPAEMSIDIQESGEVVEEILEGELSKNPHIFEDGQDFTQVEPEDWKKILEQMSPDDFKYKM